jgi:hypothetical protein
MPAAARAVNESPQAINLVINLVMALRKPVRAVTGNSLIY